MRRIAGVAALLLALSACGGGSQGAVESRPSYPSTTRPEPPVETAPTVTSTTALPTTTETTVAPWTTLPEPVCPAAVLDSELAGPEPVGSICLEVTTGGQVEPAELAAAGLADVLDLLGVPVATEGCRATFRLTVTGSRVSELYTIGQTARRCGSGLILTGESRLVVDGTTRRTWTADLNIAPPAIIEGCPDPAGEMTRAEWDDDLVATPLVEMFGEAARFAEWVGFIEAHLDTDLPPPTEDEVGWLTCWLVAQKPTAMTRLPYLAQADANQAALIPLVPYLIALLDAAQQCAGCSPADVEAADTLGLQLHSALESILSMSVSRGVSPNGAPAQTWWEVWEQRGG